MGISQDGCRVVDESDGTVIEDDEVLLELKDKVFILLASGDEWTPLQQPASPPSVSVAAATSPSPTTTVSASVKETTESHKRPSFKGKTNKAIFFEITNKLQSRDRLDPENLTDLARSLVSLDDTAEDQWNSLWANREFIQFIYDCTEHPPAEMHVVSLLKSNKTAQKLAPKSILVEFSIIYGDSATDVEIDLPKQINSLFEVRELLQRVVDSGHVPVQLMPVLEVSVNTNTRLECEMKGANAMMHWSSDRRTFQLPWNMDTVKQALDNINEYEKPSHKNRHSYSDRTHKEDSGISAANNNGPELQKFSKSGAFAQCRPTTSSLLGGQTSKVTQTEYYKICAIIPKPNVRETKLAGFTEKVLPYILQRVKMRGCCVLQPSRLSALVASQVAPAAKQRRSDPFSRKSTFGKAESKQYACPVSRLDCLTRLLGSVDSIVARDLLPVMSQFPMAFPLIMRNIAEEGKYSLLTPLLTGVVVKWESGSGKIIEHSLFNNPFKLLVAVRLGENDTGKSAILNQLLAKEHTFSTRGEPGSEYGRPITVDGSVEFIWLTQETCKDNLWESVVCHHYSGEDDTIALLANMHGDAVENPDLIALLNQCFRCRYLAFVMPTCSKTHWRSFTSMLPSKDHVSIIRIDPEDYDSSEPNDIQSSRITEDRTLHKVRSCLDEGLKSCSVVRCVSANKLCSRIFLADRIETEQSQKIIDFVANNTCKSTKGCMQLQVPSCSKKSIRKLSMTTHDVVRQFIAILQSQLDVRQRAVIHLENELSRLCNAETQKVRLELSQLKSDLRKAMVNSHSNPKDTECIRKNVADTLNVMDSMNLGVEHFFREVGYLYQLQLQSKAKNDLLTVPQKVAELFLNGHPIELLDGDAGHVQTLWLNDIFKSVAEKYPKLRVYVISIIGLQSSGKSTLLNSLFACRFAVSVGRCSRGLFMRLLFLDKEVAKACKVDAVLLIDTEGLGSPEKMGDLEAEKKDRLLATFVLWLAVSLLLRRRGLLMPSL